MNAQKHIEALPIIPAALRLHTLTAVQTRRFLAGAKFTYIKLNTPTACPPRTAVSVNRPFGDRHRCWVTFGQWCACCATAIFEN
jgi:hypothetical protein